MHTSGTIYNRVTTLFCARLTPARLTRYHHTSAAVTGGPVAALRQRRSVRNSGAMFTRTPRAPFPLSGAHCADPFGLLFPSLSLRCEVVVSIEYYPMSTKSSRQLRQIIHSPQRKFRQCPQANPPAERVTLIHGGGARGSLRAGRRGRRPLRGVRGARRGCDKKPPPANRGRKT